MTFVHVIGWFYVIIASLQFIYIVACALYGAEIEDLHIYKTKPFVQHIKDKQITIVFGCRLSECKLFSDTLKRKAIFPKILDIHKPDAAWRLFRKDYKETINSRGSANDRTSIEQAFLPIYFSTPAIHRDCQPTK